MQHGLLSSLSCSVSWSLWHSLHTAVYLPLKLHLPVYKLQQCPPKRASESQPALVSIALAPSQMAGSLLEAVEADLRALSAEAKRTDSVAGHLTGWFSGPEHPHVKDAAERTMLKLRSMSGREESVTPEEATKARCLLQSAGASACNWHVYYLMLGRMYAGGHQALPAGLRVEELQAGRHLAHQHAQAGLHQLAAGRGGDGDAEGHGAGRS